jgi:hypothetical protein
LATTSSDVDEGYHGDRGGRDTINERCVEKLRTAPLQQVKGATGAAHNTGEMIRT